MILLNVEMIYFYVVGSIFPIIFNMIYSVTYLCPIDLKCYLLVKTYMNE